MAPKKPVHGKLFINGKWVGSHSGKTFERRNPANPKELVGAFELGGKEDAKQAVDAAEDAFEEWSDTPAPKRGEILFSAAQILKERKEELARIISWEMGKPIVEGRGDVQEAIDTCEYFGGEGRRLLGHTTPSELKSKFCATIRRPVGVVGCITPWNFPVAIPSWKLAPALVCGNTVVFKPASDTPLCATKFVEILTGAGVPPGVLNMVTGPGEAVGMSIVRNKKVLGVSFTGNRDTGRAILENAGVKKVGLELGGKNAVIIMPDADMSLALDGCMWGAFGTTGQRCTAASRIILHEKVKQQFEKHFADRASKFRLGPGTDPRTHMGPLVNRAAQEKSEKYSQIGQDEGAKLLTGGRKPAREGWFFPPTVFTNVDIGMRIAQEEIFGPVVSLVPVSSLNEAIEACNSVEYGLSSSIFTRDINAAFRAIEKIEAGITYVNSATIGAEIHLPFGGVKQTGNGTREAGIEGINEFTETKTVYVDYSGKFQRAQIDG
ncbi:aldehyde dehydrogenase family protein [Candidatus Micrarchaeota archaeon]|nr:aldehyde dehydrogenase family protein [Candidatus Micrarchaeota archaeon]